MREIKLFSASAYVDRVANPILEICMLFRL